MSLTCNLISVKDKIEKALTILSGPHSLLVLQVYENLTVCCVARRSSVEDRYLSNIFYLPACRLVADRLKH